MIEVILPSRHQQELLSLLEDQKVTGVWTSDLEEYNSIVRILLPKEQTELISDLVSKRFSAADGFRLILYAVEATLPKLDEPEENTADPATAAEQPAPKRVPDRISREELYEDIAGGARISPVYIITVVLAALVAAIGLMRGDVIVIIGAMVIAPLLGPNVALALATTLGDGKLARRSLVAALIGVLTTLIIALAAGLIFPVDPFVSEILSRTQVGIGDVLLALAAGSAGALAFTSGIPTSLIGVMVAVALLPPLVTAGLLAGSGQLKLALGAVVLYITNMVCVNLAGVITFLAQRVRPRTWWEEARAKKASRLAVIIWISLLVVLFIIIFSLW